MCGIFFCVCGEGGAEEAREARAQCLELVTRRGPDKVTEAEVSLETGHSLVMASSVLWLQGESLTSQPVTDEASNILMWNGDIFDIELTDEEDRDHSESDTSLLARLLSQCVTSRDILDIMSRIHGPWAMVYFHKHSNTIWIGRDFFGRQSLLISRSDGSLRLSSCVIKENGDYVELPAYGIYKCELLKDGVIGNLTLYPWKNSADVLDMSILNNIDCDISSDPISSPVLTCSDVILEELHQIPAENKDVFSQLLTQNRIAMIVDEFEDVLRDAVLTRVLHQPDVCKDCVTNPSQECPHAAVGVLFSGGLDSCVLACLTAALIPEDKPLHLYNVAFQQSNGNYDVPDRLTGIQAFNEIKSLHPNRKISLILVNVTLSELQTERQERVRHLLHPLDTVLDDSIGCAVWFAARGRGVDSETGAEVESRARVLILGMGIDEQLGGYSRHRTSFTRAGWPGLASELTRELVNISARNLGRDNRVVSDHGVAPRFPFLDEKFVNYLATVPINLKCDFRYERGIGEKLILRLLAHKMGLKLTSREPKRAVQFGSRIAKMENRKEKGNQKAVRC